MSLGSLGSHFNEMYDNAKNDSTAESHSKDSFVKDLKEDFSNAKAQARKTWIGKKASSLKTGSFAKASALFEKSQQYLPNKQSLKKEFSDVKGALQSTKRDLRSRANACMIKHVSVDADMLMAIAKNKAESKMYHVAAKACKMMNGVVDLADHADDFKRNARHLDDIRKGWQR